MTFSTVSTLPELAIARPLHIDFAALEAMAKDAKSAFPHECCGFMFGRSLPTHLELLRVEPVINRTESNAERRFQIAPFDYLQAERRAEREGLDLLGVYHSHPMHPAIPSKHDLAVALPEFSYVILSAFEDVVISVRSWRLNGKGSFSEESIQYL